MNQMTIDWLPVLVILGVLLQGCGFSYKKRINERYAIIAVDTSDDFGVGRRYGTGTSYSARIKPKVLKVGWSDDTIYAMRDDGTHWVIFSELDSDKASAPDSTKGPYTTAQLRGVLKKRGITSVEYQWTYKNR